jgi:hypothetical protein
MPARQKPPTDSASRIPFPAFFHVSGLTFQPLPVDHIVPRAVCPEFDNVIANLELMPQRANASKNAKIGSRQVQKAEELHRAGLLTKQGLGKVRASWRQ